MATTEQTSSIGGTFTDSVPARPWTTSTRDRRVIAHVRLHRRGRRRGRRGAPRTRCPSGSTPRRASAPSCCSQLADVIDENAEELAQIESRNVGKPLIGLAREEMPFCADNLRFFAGAARNLEGKSAGEYIKGYTSMIRREPIGIVAGICPWNYPLMMAIWKLGPALAAGNVQILKPAEQTPLSLLRFVELAKDVIPAGRAAGRDRRRRADRRAARQASRHRPRLAHRRRRRPAS